MSAAARTSLIIGGIGLVMAGLLHVVVLIGGPSWIAFVGAPASVVESARAGTWLAPVTTLAIAGVLLIWAAYAFSAAGWLHRLPFRNWVLGIVAAVLILRGLLAGPMMVQANYAAAFDVFHVAMSVVVLVLGCLLAFGLYGLRRAA